MPMDQWTCPVAEETACDWKVKLTDAPIALYPGKERKGMELPLRVRDLGGGRWDLHQVNGADSIADTIGWVAQAAHLKRAHPLDPHVPTSAYLRVMGGP